MKRILVVDDEEGLRNIISQVLSDNGHEVTTASSGEAALEIFKNTPFPIVMTDIFMEQMTGIDLLHEIRSLNPTTQVVIMTSNASLESATAALRSGAYDYLTKPFDDLDAISSVISRAAEKVELIRQNERSKAELKDLNTQLTDLAIRDALPGRPYGVAQSPALLRGDRARACPLRAPPPADVPAVHRPRPFQAVQRQVRPSCR